MFTKKKKSRLIHLKSLDDFDASNLRIHTNSNVYITEFLKDKIMERIHPVLSSERQSKGW